ncbi:MAG: hypothetical protein V3T79_03425 [Candidatus Scalindua sediminis]|nr:hypothetical protein [Candidatus Scalindua sediminis]
MRRGIFGYYELPAFAIGCEHPYIAEYDEKNNYFLINHNVSISRWYPEEILRRLLSRINVGDIDATIRELKKNLMRGNFEKSDYSMYTEKCNFECHSQFIKCELCDLSYLVKN